MRRASGLLDAVGQVAEQSVGNVLRNALADHGLADLLGEIPLPGRGRGASGLQASLLEWAYRRQDQEEEL